LEPRQAASLAGLAPITRRSGKWEGRARIGGGRAQLRNALYMPALVAVRYNQTSSGSMKSSGSPESHQSWPSPPSCESSSSSQTPSSETSAAGSAISLDQHGYSKTQTHKIAAIFGRQRA